MTEQFCVVENAGYVGECDVYSDADYGKALRWINDHYDGNELDELHVAIALDKPDGTRSFEFG